MGSLAVYVLGLNFRSAKLTLLYVDVFDDEWCPGGDGGDLPECS